MKLRPSVFLLIYLSLIVIYALAYCYLPDGIHGDDFTFLKSIYFSTVTITTLGYGDITPKSNAAMMVVASEAILGIVIIGLFLSSLWQSFVSQIEEQQDMSIKKRLSQQNLHSLSSFYRYLKVVIGDYQMALVELTTPMAKRQGLTRPNPDFLFSDLQDLYGPSLLTKSGFSKPVVHHYFDKLDSLLSDLKFVLSNFDLSEYPVIHSTLVDFLTLSRAQDVREALYSYEKIGGGGKLMKDTLAEMIKEHDQCPDLETYKSNVVTPAMILYLTLKVQIPQIKTLENEFDTLMANPAVEGTPRDEAAQRPSL